MRIKNLVPAAAGVAALVANMVFNFALLAVLYQVMVPDELKAQGVMAAIGKQPGLHLSLGIANSVLAYQAGAKQIDRAVTLINLGARLQVLESETDLSYERLLRLYKEVAGKSPSKGQLPFSTDWFMTWQPNIHASLFLNIHEYLNKSSEIDEIDVVIKAYQLYLEQTQTQGLEALLSVTRAWRLVKFIDNSEITLKPSTTFKVENFSYDAGKPDGDNASFNLVKGGLRSVTGLLGKRNKEKFAMKTPSATIGIRGTTFFLEYLTGKGDLDASPGLEPGLHVHVSAGGISIVNSAGEFRYDPGQFGFIRDDKTRPVKMFTNPGMQFTPPASFGDAAILTP